MKKMYCLKKKKKKSYFFINLLVSIKVSSFWDNFGKAAIQEVLQFHLSKWIVRKGTECKTKFTNTARKVIRIPTWTRGPDKQEMV
jgi:hypothetical protein